MGVVGKNQGFLLPQGLIMSSLKPSDEELNHIRVNGMMATANSSYVGLGICCLSNPPPKSENGQRLLKKPEFIMDALKVRPLTAKQYLAYSSRD